MKVILKRSRMFARPFDRQQVPEDHVSADDQHAVVDALADPRRRDLTDRDARSSTTSRAARSSGRPGSPSSTPSKAGGIQTAS